MEEFGGTVVAETLKFTLTKGSLYSYWFAKSDTVSTRGVSNDE